MEKASVCNRCSSYALYLDIGLIIDKYRVVNIKIILGMTIFISC
ncbi:hypothetical protein SAMN05660206_10699 [Sphingobacterium wenxiniae]|uniref:Uncharacterized protein n=1 Tax=Sphingobacterium wenxiniae TaxID=683125 RepID=A0A1I6TEJ7_9SPHI|nr:hypothetical protein SAMN05660206_10699 [Sphingobacterium wenxiniae]